MSETFNVAGFNSVFQNPVIKGEFPEGLSVSDILRDTPEISKKLYLSLRVTVTTGRKTVEIPMSDWTKFKPERGSFLEIFPKVHGPAIGAILTAIISASAPAIAGSLGLVAGTFGYTLATAAISVVGALAVNALIPPPSQGGTAEATRYNIVSASNSASPFAPYPSVIGRHRMYPKKTASGYTEVVGDEVYLYERMTFGYGPVALEDLRIGTTPITEFEDIQVELLNVNRGLTNANIPGLEDLMPTKNKEEEFPAYNLNSVSASYQFTSDIPAGKVQVGLSPVFSGNVVGFTAVQQQRVVGDATWITERTYTNIAEDRFFTFPIYDDGLIREFQVVLTGFITSGGSQTSGASLQVTKTVLKYQAGNDQKSWRYNTERMNLYPNDISEDPYSVALEVGESVSRFTQIDALRASIDVAFQGLVIYNDKGVSIAINVEFDIRYRLEGVTEWTSGGTLSCTGQTAEYVRFSKDIEFEDAGRYEIEITRTTALWPGPNQREEGILTAIRTVQAGELPSHVGISEIALRIKATGELNGQIDSLNAIVQQLGRTWDGTDWSDDLVAIRHPAWCYARAFFGYATKPIEGEKVDRDFLKSWADDYPHWTCDAVIEGETRIIDVLNLICATGRASFGLLDMKFGAILDGAGGAPVQHFTHRNSYDFSGFRFLNRDIHAFRVRVISERADWQEEEFMVYRDGYDQTNATEIETLELPGVVIAEGEGTQGNAWKLARYHMAVSILRSEEITFSCDLDHMRCQRGDVVRINHDVILAGVGAGLITSTVRGPTNAINTLGLDEILDTVSGTVYRLRIRQSNGEEFLWDGTHDGDGFWQYDPGNGPAPLVNIGDLVLVEQVDSVPVDLVVKSIRPEADLRAQLVCVPAAPEVLTADTGTIPDFVPNITEPLIDGPNVPSVLGIRTGFDVSEQARDGQLTPRIAVQLNPTTDKRNSFNVDEGLTFYQLRWRPSNSTRWQMGTPTQYKSEIYTNGVDEGKEYVVEVKSYFFASGATEGWIIAGTITATANEEVPDAPTGWFGRSGIDTISLSTLTFVNTDLSEFSFFAATADSTDLTFIGSQSKPPFVYQPDPADAYTRYKVTQINQFGEPSDPTEFIEVIPTKVRETELADDVTISLDEAKAATVRASQIAAKGITNHSFEDNNTIEAGVPAGWQYDGTHAVSRVGWMQQTRSGADGTTSFGVETFNQFGSAGWWLLEKTIKVTAGADITFSAWALGAGDLPADLLHRPGQMFSAEDDGYIEVVELDVDGIEIATHVGLTTSETAFQDSLPITDWQQLVLSLTLSATTNHVLLRLVATDGNDTIVALSNRAGNAAVLFDDVSIVSTASWYDEGQQTVANTAAVELQATAISNIESSLGEYNVTVTAGAVTGEFTIVAFEDESTSISEIVLTNLNMRSSNYAEDAGGTPTAGFFLDSINGKIKGKEVITSALLAPNVVTQLVTGAATDTTLPSTAAGSNTLTDYLVVKFDEMVDDQDKITPIPARAGYKREAIVEYWVEGSTTGGTLPLGDYIGQVKVGLITAGFGTYIVDGDVESPVWAISGYRQSGIDHRNDFAPSLGANVYIGFALQNLTDRDLSVGMKVTVREIKE